MSKLTPITVKAHTCARDPYQLVVKGICLICVIFISGHSSLRVNAQAFKKYCDIVKYLYTRNQSLETIPAFSSA